MVSEIIYTDGACSGNGTANATGGFGVYIAKSSLLKAPMKINHKGEHMSFEDNTMYVTNIRMEGLAIVSTLAIYANMLTKSVPPKDVIRHMNDSSPFNLTEPKITYGAGELKTAHVDRSVSIEIVTDSQFWINVVETWMPNWIKKKIMLEKKNPDILLMMCYYTQLLKQNSIEYKFTHVRSHQKGKRTFHADGNDVADVLATSSAANKKTGFVVCD